MSQAVPTLKHVDNLRFEATNRQLAQQSTNGVVPRRQRHACDRAWVIKNTRVGMASNQQQIGQAEPIAGGAERIAEIKNNLTIDELEN
jgi:hypothetical protein